MAWGVPLAGGRCSQGRCRAGGWLPREPLVSLPVLVPCRQSPAQGREGVPGGTELLPALPPGLPVTPRGSCLSLRPGTPGIPAASSFPAIPGSGEWVPALLGCWDELQEVSSQPARPWAWLGTCSSISRAAGGEEGMRDPLGCQQGFGNGGMLGLEVLGMLHCSPWGGAGGSGWAGLGGLGHWWPVGGSGSWIHHSGGGWDLCWSSPAKLPRLQILSLG